MISGLVSCTGFDGSNVDHSKDCKTECDQRLCLISFLGAPEEVLEKDEITDGL